MRYDPSDIQSAYSDMNCIEPETADNVERPRRGTTVRILGELELTDNFESADFTRIERTLNRILENNVNSCVKSSGIELELISQGSEPEERHSSLCVCCDCADAPLETEND